MPSDGRSRYNIAHILPWPSVGGTEYGTLRLIKALEDDRFENVAFYVSGSEAIRELFSSAGLKVADYEPIEFSRYQPGAFLYASLKLARKMRRMRIDLVHCSDLLASYYVGLAGRLAGLPIVCHVRNRYQNIPWRDKNLLRAVNRFIFVSRDTWRRFGYKIPPGRGEVIYDGLVEIEELSCCKARQEVRREFDIPETARIVGMVARIAPQKDFKTLIKAARRVVDTEGDVRFLVVGDNSGAEEYRDHYREVMRLLAEHGVADYFIFTGFRDDVPRMISVMDLFVLSTHCEGLPLVILEAMAQAKPVIATAIDGIPEVVLDNETGALYAHEDETQLSQRILSMLKDEQRASRLGRAARDLVKTRFNKEQFSKRVTGLYCQMLGIKSGASGVFDEAGSKGTVQGA